MFEKIRADYKRHRSLRNPGFWLLAVYRFGRWSRELPWPAKKVCSAAYGALLTGSDFVLGTTLHRETTIGDGFHIIHADSIRIDPKAVIGNRVGIMQGVTIGTTPDRAGVPVIGDDVFIGAGARILGPVRVGDRARIAANSLVLNDVPPDTTAIGVPARVLRYTGRAGAPNESADAAVPAKADGT